MIPVVPQPEPASFNEEVRLPGTAFLLITSNPTTKEFKKAEHWRKALKDLYSSYNEVCAYTSTWIPSLSNLSVEHYIPKSIIPNLAYEWDNFRLAFSKINSRKWKFLDVVDPFGIPNNSFILEFPSLLIKPGPGLNDLLRKRVISTIKRLKLNDDDACVKNRADWLLPYCRNEFTFDYLRRKAPFLAYELDRQGLIEGIREIMLGTH